MKKLTNNQIRMFHYLKDKMSLKQLESARNLIMGKIESIRRNNELLMHIPHKIGGKRK